MTHLKSTPQLMKPLPDDVWTAFYSPRAGVVDDLIKEDDDRGFEPEPNPEDCVLANPEYPCSCGGWHAGPCPNGQYQTLGQLLTRTAREADARVPEHRQARRTLQEMTPNYERQPVLTLHRPVMADDACPLCGYWTCRCHETRYQQPAAIYA